MIEVEVDLAKMQMGTTSHMVLKCITL